MGWRIGPRSATTASARVGPSILANNRPTAPPPPTRARQQIADVPLVISKFIQLGYGADGGLGGNTRSTAQRITCCPLDRAEGPTGLNRPEGARRIRDRLPGRWPTLRLPEAW